MKILITGITGTLGQELLRLAEADDSVEEILGISRDEQKQRLIQSPKLTLRLCDVRDYRSVFDSAQGIDVVFHCAALKCVDTLEENPGEAIKTNIDGTRNVVRAASDSGVKSLVMASTDKAVFPINVYGISKAAAERIVQNAGYSVCRYGNVVGSRGSVIPIFVKAIQEKRPLPITSPEMTRYWIAIEDAAKFIYLQGMYRAPGLHIPKMKASRITEVARAVCDLMNKPKYAHKHVGIRAGEKIHECLYTNKNGDESSYSNTHEQYAFPELIELIEPVVRRMI